MSYVSTDPVWAAKDELHDARSTHRRAHWYYVWRFVAHALIIVGLVGAIVYGVWGAEVGIDTGNVAASIAISCAILNIIAFFCLWGRFKTRYGRDTWEAWDHNRLSDTRAAKREAKRKLRDAKAARQTQDNEKVRSKAEDIAVAKLAQQMVDEWQPPAGWTPK